MHVIGYGCVDVDLTVLKAYSLMLNRGRSQNFQNLIFLYISVALL